ncbi:MAG: M48 family metallopeptidase [Fimbriimonadaceae bacterium]
MKRRTLTEQIAANKRASFWYASLLVFLLAAMGAAIGGYLDPSLWLAGAGIAALVGVGCALFARYAGTSVVLSISGARDATHEEFQVLSNVTDEMAIAAGLPRPRLMVIDDTAPNAFATGPSPDKAVIVVTTGLLGKLDRDELQGVIAHEMAHIRNYDVRFMTTIAIVAGLIPLLADGMRRMLWYGGGRRSNSRDQSAVIFLILMVVLAIVAPIFAKLLELAVSRQREFMADASAAELTRNPDGLIRALLKISGDREVLEAANRATQHMYIVNPIKSFEERASSLFSTHPPVQDRVRALRSLAGYVAPSRRAPDDYSDMPGVVDPSGR